MAFFDFLKRLVPFKSFLGNAPGASAQPSPSGAAPPPPPQATAPAGSGDEWLLSGTWLHLASSNVDAIKYVYDDRKLDTAFLSGALYEYYDVPPDVAEAFSRTSSPGRFVWRILRARNYDYVRLTFASAQAKRPAPKVVRPVLPGELAKKWAGKVPFVGLKPSWMK